MGIVKRNYRVSQNLVIRFTDDGIDESKRLAPVLATTAAGCDNVDLTYKSLPGNHARPVQQPVPEEVLRALEVPPSMASTVEQVAQAVSESTASTPLEPVGEAAMSFAQAGNEMVGLDQAKEAIVEDVTKLVDEVSDWITYSMRVVDW
mmetsp:Transcript_5831/g.21261  ORF Transcript_5831/g.21261 Transcript_5831/m.21261 type:complete len:148 (+) Transcript_5831:359-802(+)